MDQFPFYFQKASLYRLQKVQEYYLRIGMVGGKGQMVFSDPLARWYNKRAGVSVIVSHFDC